MADAVMAGAAAQPGEGAALCNPRAGSFSLILSGAVGVLEMAKERVRPLEARSCLPCVMLFGLLSFLNTPIVDT